MEPRQSDRRGTIVAQSFEGETFLGPQHALTTLQGVLAKKQTADAAAGAQASTTANDAPSARATK